MEIAVEAIFSGIFLHECLQKRLRASARRKFMRGNDAAIRVEDDCDEGQAGLRRFVDFLRFGHAFI